jgi:hypothetical protein
MVAVWQLFLPVLAYAHLSKSGELSQEVCTSMGMKTVAIAPTAKLDLDIGSVDRATPNEHPCCVFHLSAAPSFGFQSVSFETPAQSLVSSCSSVLWISDFLSLHLPPTGPPPLI